MAQLSANINIFVICIPSLEYPLPSVPFEEHILKLLYKKRFLEYINIYGKFINLMKDQKHFIGIL